MIELFVPSPSTQSIAKRIAHGVAVKQLDDQNPALWASSWCLLAFQRTMLPENNATSQLSVHGNLRNISSVSWERWNNFPPSQTLFAAAVVDKLP